MTYTLFIIQFVLAIILTIFILLQKSSSLGLGAYSGSNDSVFGAKGPASFLTKITFIFGILFVINTLLLGYYYNKEKLSSAVDTVNIESMIPEAPKVQTPPKMPEPEISKKEIETVRIDSDKDGIFDDEDICPNTKPNSKVNEKGCGLLEEPENLGITFEMNSDIITSKDTKKFDKFIDYLKENKDAKIVIEAHTDSIGQDEANLVLSQKRAQSAKQILLNKGISENQIESIGYGETKPLFDNDTEENKQKNRRVTARIVK